MLAMILLDLEFGLLFSIGVYGSYFHHAHAPLDLKWFAYSPCSNTTTKPHHSACMAPYTLDALQALYSTSYKGSMTD